MTGTFTCGGDDQFVDLDLMSDGSGSYDFTGLYSGRYRLTTEQVARYADGIRSIGSAGGTANTIGSSPSVVTDIVLGVHQNETGYNFANNRHEMTITKLSSESGALVPGRTVTYTIIASNVGAVTATPVVIQDTFDSSIFANVAWTCTGTGGAACPNASGSGSINETATNIPAGGALTYTAVATLNSAIPGVVGNTATINIAGDSLFCVPSNTPGPCSSSVTNPPAPVLAVTQTVSQATATRGAAVTYRLVVDSLNAVVTTDGTQITNYVPAGLANVSWTCTADSGAVCPTIAGTGDINETIATFPGGSKLTYDITATVADTAAFGIIASTATANLADARCMPAFSNGPCASTVSLEVVDATITPTTPAPAPSPTIPGAPNTGIARSLGMTASALAGATLAAGSFIAIRRKKASHDN